MDQLQATLARWLPLPHNSTAAQDPAPAPQHQPVDVAHIRALLADIMPLLASNKFASIACFRQLQEALAGTELADEWRRPHTCCRSFALIWCNNACADWRHSRAGMQRRAAV